VALDDLRCHASHVLNPAFAKACVRDGHEIAAHGERWLDLWEPGLGVEAENEGIRRAVRGLG
jgi:hypothetical protein